MNKSFDKAAAFLPSCIDVLSDEQKIYFYCRFKQANIGPCNISKPYFYQVKELQKWQAWKSLGSMEKEQAMAEYVEKLTELMPNWLESTINASTSWVSVSRMRPEECTNTNKNYFDFVQEGHLDRVIEFEDHSKRDEFNMTSLHWACDRGYEDMVKFLISKQVDINSQDNDLQTPLHYAAACDHPKIVNILMKSGANKLIKDNENNLPSDLTNSSEILSLLS